MFTLVVSCGLAPLANASATELFTVADSIELTRIVDPAKTSLYGSVGEIKRSPDGSHFFIVTQKGNLEADTLRYELLLFNVDEVLGFVAHDNTVETLSPQVLASFDWDAIGVGARSDGINQARWLPDSKRIAFLGEQADLPAQVYSIDIRTGVLRQLTTHATPVLHFSMAHEADRLVYVANNEPPDWEERNRKGYAVAPENAKSFLKLEPNTIYTYAGQSFYVQDYSEYGSNATKVPVASNSIDPYAEIWLSPSGRWAIALAYAPDVPANWLAGYEVLQRIGNAKKQAEDNPAFPDKRSLVRRFVLIDTEDGAILDVMRSPISWGRQDVHWSLDERHVVLSNTHLPLDGVNRQELALRQKTVSVVEFELGTRRVTPIDHFAVHSGGGRLVRVDRAGRGLIAVQYRRPGDTGVHSAYYRKTSTGDWVETESGEASIDNQRLSVSVIQNMNTPPNILATDRTTNHSRRITDLNPQLDNGLLGYVKKIEWTDANERVWQGGLIYPPDYDAARRYPLVIQTYGFSEDEYVVDGPNGITSAFAARPLAGLGIIVLQMDVRPKENRFTYGDTMEGPNFIAGFEGAVYALDELGVIDPRRVGLIGFSRTGLHVSYAVAFSKIQFAAATIADSTSAGYLTHIYNFGVPFPGMINDESQIGAPFWGEGREVWLENSPNLNAHRVYTPLRLEHYGISNNPYWDMFALLKRNRRPVEMIHIPLAHHVLQRPQARYTSQQGNVDWFAFWLKGYEDPDPSKAQQYERWRKLRVDHLQSRRKVEDIGVSASIADSNIKQE